MPPPPLDLRSPKPSGQGPSKPGIAGPGGKTAQPLQPDRPPQAVNTGQSQSAGPARNGADTQGKVPSGQGLATEQRIGVQLLQARSKDLNEQQKLLEGQVKATTKQQENEIRETNSSAQEIIKKPPSKIAYLLIMIYAIFLDGIEIIIAVAAVIGIAVAPPVVALYVALQGVDAFIDIPIDLYAYSSKRKIKRGKKVREVAVKHIQSALNKINAYEQKIRKAAVAARKAGKLTQKAARVAKIGKVGQKAASIAKASKFLGKSVKKYSGMLKFLIMKAGDYVPLLEILPFRIYGVYQIHKDRKETIKDTREALVQYNQTKRDEVDAYNRSVQLDQLLLQDEAADIQSEANKLRERAKAA